MSPTATAPQSRPDGCPAGPSPAEPLPGWPAAHCGPCHAVELPHALQHSVHPMALADAGGRVRWANHPFEALCGGVPVLGQPLQALLLTQGFDVDPLPALDAVPSAPFDTHRVGRAENPTDLRLHLRAVPMPGLDAGQALLVELIDISELAAQRRQIAALLEALPNGVVIRDEQGHVQLCNPAAERQLQLSRTQLLGEDAIDPRWQTLHADLRPMRADERPAMQVLTSGQGVRNALMGVQGTAGHLSWLLVNAQPMRDAGGRVTGTVACFTDITAQRNQQAVLSHTVEAAGLGTWQWDMRTGALHYNERLLTMLGYRHGDIGQRMLDWSRLVHPEDRRSWRYALRQHLQDAATPCRCELRVRRPDGDWATVLSCGVVIEREPDGTPVLMAGINIDMTEQMQMQAMLRHAARTDGLTQLPNRAAVFDRVQQVIERSRRTAGEHFALLYMDFDRFKQVNDTLGHNAGDELLRQIAQRLRGALRSSDTVGQFEVPSSDPTAGRIGGDEFVVVLDRLKARGDACLVARRLLDVLADPYRIDSHTVHSSASIGIVTDEHAVADAATAMRDADTAMYEAKRAGRGRYVVFDPAMHESVARGVAIEADLRLALPNKELFVVYQPVVDLQPGGGTGVEALVRWQHPTRGLVPPLQFIGVAEETGLIVDLGQFVLETACRQFVAWREALGEAAPRMLSVNLSPVQLRWPGLVESVRQVLESTGIGTDAGVLQLEVTESLAAQDEAARAKLRELKALGVRVALDDFGTGYSSLACLHQLPVDTVKIDRSFVTHAETSDYHRVLIEATIRVARTLGMLTVAEGIETEGQGTLLRALQCDRGQGYFFARPLAADALMDWCQQRHAAEATTTADTAPAAPLATGP